jgi:plastocyanin
MFIGIYVNICTLNPTKLFYGYRCRPWPMSAKIAAATAAVRLPVFLAAAIAILVSQITAATVAMPAYAAEEIAADITQGSSSKTLDAFSPNPANVHIGDIVTWTNRDSIPHTVTSGINGRPDGRFDSSPNFNPLILPLAAFSHTFTESGGYPYYCSLHPNMIGTVIVAAAAAPSSNQTASREFTITGADEEGNEHQITGVSQNATAKLFTINPGNSVDIQFNGTGEVELTLPKSIIANITAVQAGTGTIQYAAAKENDTSTTISFSVPEDQIPVRIMGGFVIPEFPYIAAIVLAGTLTVITGFSRFTRNRIRLRLFRRT